MSGETKKASWEDNYQMEPEYDFSDSVPNPYASRFSKGTAVILLEPDIAKKFPDSKSVNEALRAIIHPSPDKLTKAS